MTGTVTKAVRVHGEHVGQTVHRDVDLHRIVCLRAVLDVSGSFASASPALTR